MKFYAPSSLATEKQNEARQLNTKLLSMLPSVASKCPPAGRAFRQLGKYQAKSRYVSATTIPADKELYQRQIKATDRRIDALAYELYGLTEEEIGVVERQNH